MKLQELLKTVKQKGVSELTFMEIRGYDETFVTFYKNGEIDAYEEKIDFLKSHLDYEVEKVMYSPDIWKVDGESGEFKKEEYENWIFVIIEQDYEYLKRKGVY